MGSEQWIKLPSVLVPKGGLMGGRRVGVLRCAEQNGAALFEMFSYLILCPSQGSSLICLAWPCSCHCSTAYLVQLMIPGAACHSISVHLQGSCLWSLHVSSFLLLFCFCCCFLKFLGFYVVGFTCFYGRLGGESSHGSLPFKWGWENNLIFCYVLFFFVFT